MVARLFAAMWVNMNVTNNIALFSVYKSVCKELHSGMVTIKKEVLSFFHKKIP